MPVAAVMRQYAREGAVVARMRLARRVKVKAPSVGAYHCERLLHNVFHVLLAHGKMHLVNVVILFNYNLKERFRGMQAKLFGNLRYRFTHHPCVLFACQAGYEVIAPVVAYVRVNLQPYARACILVRKAALNGLEPAFKRPAGYVRA